MLRMEPFRVEYPTTLGEAVRLLSEARGKAKICAGGTDLIPNLKHSLYEPELVVHLAKIPDLSAIEDRGDHLVIGAKATLHDVETSRAVLRDAPSLARAASEVAGPQHRQMGTIGGNLCLETRCLYYNQTHFWREALGFCLKKDGSVCHVVAGGQKCVAASSNDTATALMCLDAKVDLISPRGERTLTLDELYVQDGIKNTVLADDEIVVRVRIDKPASGLARREGFAKLRHRNAIDFPLLSIAVRADVDRTGAIVRARVVVNGLQAKPHAVKLDFANGSLLDAALIDRIAREAEKRCVPTTSIADDPSWRREMIPTYVRRAFSEASNGSA